MGLPSRCGGTLCALARPAGARARTTWLSASTPSPDGHVTDSSSKATGRPEPPDGTDAVTCALRALLALLKPADGQPGADTVVGEISLDGRTYTITRSAPPTAYDDPVALSAREREVAGL